MLAIIFFVLLLWLHFYSTRHPKNFPPHPRFTLPLLGDTLSVGKDTNEGFKRMHKTLGPIFGLWLGPIRAVVVSDFDMITEAGAKSELIDRPYLGTVHGKQKANSTFNCANLKELRESPEFPAGVLFANGSNWKEQRRFTLQTLRDLGFGKTTHEEFIADECQELCDRLAKANGQPIPTDHEFNISAVNALWAIITGERLNYNDLRGQKIIQYLTEFTEDFSSPIGSWMAMVRPFGILADKFGLYKGGNALRELNSFAKDTIASSFQRYQEDDDLSTFNDCYIKKMRQNVSNPLSSFHGSQGDANFKAVLFDLFIAGSDTTSVTLNWAILFMIMHPDIQKKVHQELDGVFGKGHTPTASERHKTPYIEAVLQEVQRKGNILNIATLHKAGADATIGGYFIPKGTVIYPHLGEIFRNEAYFPNPENFDPNRYLENGVFKPNPKLVPFGIGRRRCLGETLARMELYMFFTGIMSRFELKKEDESIVLDDTPTNNFVLSPKPFKVKFLPRY